MSTIFDEVIEKFGPPKGGHVLEETEIARLRGALPDPYLAFLKDIGVGVWMDGFFQLIEPEKYQPIVEMIFGHDKELKPSDIRIVGFSAFGSILAWSPRLWAIDINVLFHTVRCLYLFKEPPKIDAGKAFSNTLYLVDAGANDTVAADGKPLFKRALKAYGALPFGQIYAPKLHPALGGPRTLDNFRPASALEALALAAQAGPFMLEHSLRTVREIG